MISNSGSDERKQFSGGKAGDQTGKEWAIINWYNRPWNVVLRHPNKTVANLIAELAEEAANNDFIGYDQGQRTTFWNQLKQAGYRPSKITIPCEADCSAGVAAVIKAAGYLLGDSALKSVSPDAYTGNLRKILVSVGFEELRESRFLTGDGSLLRGDVLLYENHHTAINLNDGDLTKDILKISITTGENGLEVLEDLNIRRGPGAEYSLTGKTCPKGSLIFPKHRSISNHDASWFEMGDGWVSGKYLKGWIGEEDLWWYLEKNYKYPSSCIKRIDGKQWIFDDSGWLVTKDRISDNGELLPL